MLPRFCKARMLIEEKSIKKTKPKILKTSCALKSSKSMEERIIRPMERSKSEGMISKKSKSLKNVMTQP